MKLSGQVSRCISCLCSGAAFKLRLLLLEFAWTMWEVFLCLLPCLPDLCSLTWLTKLELGPALSQQTCPGSLGLRRPRSPAPTYLCSPCSAAVGSAFLGWYCLTLPAVPCQSVGNRSSGWLLQDNFLEVDVGQHIASSLRPHIHVLAKRSALSVLAYNTV